MKLIVAALLICLAQQKPDQMKGVKTCTEYVFEVEADREEALVVKRILTYNERGDIVEEVTECRGEARFVESYEYEYDGKNRKTACIYRMDGALRAKSTYSYTADGSSTESRMLYEGKKGEEKALRASTYDYNAKGLMTGEAHNSARGPADPRISYAYDEKGRQTEKKMFFVNSPFPEVTATSYEEKGAFLTKILKDENGAVLGKIVEHRNDHGDPLQIHYRGKDDKEYDQRIYEYAYDGDGRMLIKMVGKAESVQLVLSKRHTYQYELFEKK